MQVNSITLISFPWSRAPPTSTSGLKYSSISLDSLTQPLQAQCIIPRCFSYIITSVHVLRINPSARVCDPEILFIGHALDIELDESPSTFITSSIACNLASFSNLFSNSIESAEELLNYSPINCRHSLVDTRNDVCPNRKQHLDVPSSSSPQRRVHFIREHS